MHIHCLAHVINLVVQAFLAVLNEADDPDLTDYYELSKQLSIHLNIDDDEDQQALDNETIKDLQDRLGDNTDAMDVDDDEEIELDSASEKSLSAVEKVCVSYFNGLF